MDRLTDRIYGWRTAAKKPIKNAELWQALLAAAERHRVKWTWVRGHAGQPENERADRLTSDAAMAAGRRMMSDHYRILVSLGGNL